MGDRPRLVVSFHDLTPVSRPLCDRFLRCLEAWGVPRISLLVVPRWHRGQAFTADRAFVSWLKERAAQGHEVSLHGFFHRAERVTGGPVARFLGQIYTAREGEFFQIRFCEAEQKVREGLALFQQAGLPVCGFTPPAWLLSREGREALKYLGLSYTTSLQHVDFLQAGRRLRAPTLVFSSRSAWRRYVSQAWVRFAFNRHRHCPLLRVAVHPLDFMYPAIEQSLYSLIQRGIETRTPCTYRDLLARPAWA